MKNGSRILKRTCALFLIIAAVMLNAFPAQACTAVYVGQDASDDGTIMLARSNDYQDVWANYVTIIERVENKPGRTMPVDHDATVLAPLPDTTYRYTATPWMDSTVASNGSDRDATVCTNEYGVAMTMSVTAFSNSAVLKADPLIGHGLTENTAVDLVVCQSATAREGVEVLLSLIDTYGSSEINIAMIADQKEAWYIEMYSGHQYAAVKLPTDAVCAFGNEFSLEYLSDYEDYIISPDLEKLAKDSGFAVYGRGNELNLLATCSGEEMVTDYSHRRTWIAHRLLAPSGYGDYDKKTLYPLCFSPDKKVSLQDVMAIMRNRFEGTQYSPDETGRTDIRVIGTDTALSVHVAQVYPQLPTEMSCVTWESTGPALNGVFVPVSNAAISVSEAYGRNQPAEDAGIFDPETYPYYAFKELTTLGVEPKDCKVYGVPVRDYWNKAETGMTQGMRQVLSNAAGIEDREQAALYITDYCNQTQTQTFSDARQLLNDVRWYHSKNSNTLKNGRNPETHEVIDELKEIDPLEVSLSADPYFVVPEISEKGQSPAQTNQTVIGAAAVVLVLAGALYLLIKRRKG